MKQRGKTHIRRITSFFLVLVLTFAVSLAGCGSTADTTEVSSGTQADEESTSKVSSIQTDSDGIDYGSSDMWAYQESDVQGKDADVFFVCPTVYIGTDTEHIMSLDDTKSMSSFLGATNMEIGIYNGSCRVFAPYYRQAALNIYDMSIEEQEPYLMSAYQDIREAFSYYMEHYNQGRPIVLAGFSQGADMCIRLLKEFFADEKTESQLVACYAVGWRLTEEEVKEYPQLKAAQGEDDTGVIIAFNSEAEDIDDSFVVPNGMKTLAINPLNWKTDSTVADKELNLGACFTDYDANIKTEINNLTGAYIDEVRGVLKVTDVTPEEYPGSISIVTDGIYHVYDYQFFYRNLQKNVDTRIAAYLSRG